jgi:hypothetical protein
LSKIKEDYTKIKIDYDNLLIANELLSCNTHEAIDPAVKIDVATSCDDLSQDDQSSLHDELTEKVEVLTLDNQKLNAKVQQRPIPSKSVAHEHCHEKQQEWYWI